MCELLGMSSDLPATLNISLGTLAAHGGPPASISDGWGVAYYEGKDVRLIKDAGPIIESDWVRFIREHDLRSAIVMAHIRKATMGDIAYRNAQPFARELAGRMHVFAHNGRLPGIFDSPRFRSERYSPVGDTDSEQAFCALLEHMLRIWRQTGEIPSVEARLAVVATFAKDLRSLGPANFLYSDGDTLFAHGDCRMQAATGRIEPPGLFIHQHWCRRTAEGFAESGVSIEDADQTIAIVTSVPLTRDGWTPLAQGEVIAISKGKILTQQSSPFHGST